MDCGIDKQSGAMDVVNTNMQSNIKKPEMSVRKEGLTLRAVVISSLAIFLIGYVLHRADMFAMLPGINVGTIHPASGPLGIVLFMILVISPIMKLLKKGFRFAQSELVSVYMMVATGAFFSQGAVFGYFIMGLMTLPNLADFVPDTYGAFVPLISRLVAPWSEDSVIGFWDGKASVPWGEWAVPILMWSLFFFALFFLSLSIATIVRRHWTDRERLRYPISEPILAICNMSANKGVWHDKKVWIGAAISMIMLLPGYLHRYIPFIPSVSYTGTIHEYLAEPWKSIFFWPEPWFVYSISPLGVGLGYLISLDLSFSIWFFYLFKFALRIVYYSFGLRLYQGIPNEMEQVIGSFLGIGVFVLWITRYQLGDIIKKALVLKGADSIDDSDEPVSYSTAFFGGIASLLFIFFFASRLLNIGFVVLLVYFMIFVATIIAIARIRCEAGIPWGGSIGYWIEQHSIQGTVGVKVIGPDQMTGLGILKFLQHGRMAALGALMLEGYKMADETNMRRRSMTTALVVGFIIGIVVMFALGLPLLYSHGANLATEHMIFIGGGVPFGPIVDAQRGAPAAQPLKAVYAAGALVFTLFLMYMRTSFLWWPFHPVGYAWSVMNAAWMFATNCLIAWIIKLFVLRYGGASLFKRLTPIFVGLIVGHVMIEFVFSLIGVILGY